MYFGRPTGSAMPLMWAHAEYVRLLRSAFDGQAFDLVPEVAERYLAPERKCVPLEVWKPNRRCRSVRRGMTLRVQASSPFRLRWTRDDWQRVEDTPSTPTALGIHFVDIPVPPAQQAPVRFTFFWTESAHWEGRDYQVAVLPAGG
jgi:glucoamylase